MPLRRRASAMALPMYSAILLSRDKFRSIKNVRAGQAGGPLSDQTRDATKYRVGETWLQFLFRGWSIGLE